MNVEHADYLLGLEKYVIENNDLIELKEIKLESPVKFRFLLGTKDDLDQIFFLNIKESEKKAFKISLHHQDDTTHSGILRLDYYGRHKNPVNILDSVPDCFKDFAGCYLDEYAGHMHYIVDGYPPLVWAIPLESDDFPIKDICSVDDTALILKAFLDKINVKTRFEISTQPRLQWIG